MPLQAEEETTSREKETGRQGLKGRRSPQLRELGCRKSSSEVWDGYFKGRQGPARMLEQHWALGGQVPGHSALPEYRASRPAQASRLLNLFHKEVTGPLRLALLPARHPQPQSRTLLVTSFGFEA